MTSPELAAATSPEANPSAKRCLGVWRGGSRGSGLMTGAGQVSAQRRAPSVAVSCGLTGCMVSPDSRVPRPSVPRPRNRQGGRFWGAAAPSRQHSPLGCHRHPPASPCSPPAPQNEPSWPRAACWPPARGADTQPGSLGERSCLLAGSPARTHQATKPRASALAPGCQPVARSPRHQPGFGRGGGTAPENPPTVPHGVISQAWGHTHTHARCRQGCSPLPGTAAACLIALKAQQMAEWLQDVLLPHFGAPSLAFLQNSSKEGGWEEPCVHGAGGWGTMTPATVAEHGDALQPGN